MFKECLVKLLLLIGARHEKWRAFFCLIGILHNENKECGFLIIVRKRSLCESNKYETGKTGRFSVGV